MQVTARQLHLFRSRKQRGIAAPGPSEYQLHCMVVDTVRRWRMPGWIFTHIASRGSWLLDDPETRARWDAEHQRIPVLLHEAGVALRFTKKGPIE